MTAPAWVQAPPVPGSWRSLLKWGDPEAVKHPAPRLWEVLKRHFRMEDNDVTVPAATGNQRVELDAPVRLPPGTLETLRAMLGEAGVATDGFTRLRAAYGKTMLDLLRLRKGLAENLPDAVLYPRNRQDVERIVACCAERGIPVVARGGGSSVTRGLEAPLGGVSLDLTRHMAKVVAFSETDHTITVEPGMYGPALEKLLNAAPELFGASRPFTCGHFPQSFEYSTVGGWVATRGAGQNSTYYGKIEDLVLAQEYVTPAGLLRTKAFPAAAAGPDTDQILVGSECAFGILTEVTLKVFHFEPGHRRRFGYLFPDWPSGLGAARELLQAEAGFPSVFRLSDPEETEVVLKLYGAEHRAADAVLGLLGLEPGRRCLLLGSADGDKGYARNVARQMGRIARRFRALPITGLVTKAWEHGRFQDPYLRDDLQDFGIMTDTLECAVTWDHLERVHREVRAYCHGRPDTLCMTHLSHAYPQGANLYFVFMARLASIPGYLAYQAGILDTIRAQGACLSHHHGIGRMTAPWLEGQLGKVQMDLFRAIKRQLDPGGIMNPGGTLGLDLPEDQKR